MTEKHGGNMMKLAQAAGCLPEEICDFSANINPLGPPESLSRVISSRISSLVHYPDPDCTELISTAAKQFGLPPGQILAGNGSTELLYLLPRAAGASRAVIPVPSYADYTAAAGLCGLPVEKVELSEENGFEPEPAALASLLRDNDLVFLGQPNNPTGRLFDPHHLRSLAYGFPRVTFAVDESFLPFAGGAQSIMINRPPNVVVLMSLTKFYAIPGLRLGLAVADRSIIAGLQTLLPPWSVNTLAQAAGAAALQDEDYAVKSRSFTETERPWLQKELEKIPGLTVNPGCANFLLARINRSGYDARRLADALLTSGIAIRVCDNFDGLDSRYFRVAVRLREDNSRLIDALQSALGEKKATHL